MPHRVGMGIIRALAFFHDGGGSHAYEHKNVKNEYNLFNILSRNLDTISAAKLRYYSVYKQDFIRIFRGSDKKAAKNAFDSLAAFLIFVSSLISYH